MIAAITSLASTVCARMKPPSDTRCGLNSRAVGGPFDGPGSCSAVRHQDLSRSRLRSHRSRLAGVGSPPRPCRRDPLLRQARMTFSGRSRFRTLFQLRLAPLDRTFRLPPSATYVHTPLAMLLAFSRSPASIIWKIISSRTDSSPEAAHVGARTSRTSPTTSINFLRSLHSTGVALKGLTTSVHVARGETPMGWIENIRDLPQRRRP